MIREEAIRRIKAWNLDADDMEVLSEVIPELKESEDEKIRQGIVETIKQCTDILGPKNQKQMLAWLEKQKEQKPIEWSKNDTVFLNEITDYFENKTVRLQHDLDIYAHWLKSLHLRLLQKLK